MTEYVFVADPTLSAGDYHNVPLLAFSPCAPVKFIPTWLHDYLSGPRLPVENGRAVVAPYAIRKLEAALLGQGYREDQIAVAHPDYVEHFIREDTKVIAVHTMDPLGLGPLTMMFTNGRSMTSIAEREFTDMMTRISHARKTRGGPKTKIAVGGPGAWELWYMRDYVVKAGIDYVFYGECEDLAGDLFKQFYDGSFDNRFFRGFQTFDETFHKKWEPDATGRFVTRAPMKKQFPDISEIPNIVRPSYQGLTECMRGCGIGCDFCEVTLRPTRYYPPEKVVEEIMVNRKHGVHRSWLHSDEFFAYMHGRRFEPNQDALVKLSEAIISTGLPSYNPTHGRISVPAGYPELMEKLSKVMRAGPDNWIGVQVGLETGSDTLAKKHMPNKTLPLQIGADGTWAEIVRDGTVNMNKYYWRPAFTVQIGQAEETQEDNWMTVGLINDLSNAGLEFSVSPLYNVPLGIIKESVGFKYDIYGRLDEAQAAVIYASFRHLQKMVMRRSFGLVKGDFWTKIFTSTVLQGGCAAVNFGLDMIFRKKGLDLSKAKSHSLNLFS